MLNYFSKNKKRNKKAGHWFMAIILSTLMACSVIIPNNVVFASHEKVGNLSEDQNITYVAVMNDSSSYQQVMRTADAMDVVSEEQPQQLKENNIAVLVLEGSDSKKIERIDGVVSLEEDILLTANEEVEINERVVNNLAKREATIPFSQWNMEAIHLPDNTELTGNGVKVAVLDSGISFTEDVFVKEFVDLTNSGNENPLFNDGSGHGTSIASLIAASDTCGDLCGIAPEVELYDVKILDGGNIAPLSKVIEGIYWCIDNGMDIINMSFGTSDYSPALEQAIDAAEEAGIIMIAAAGNHGDEARNIDYPAAFDNVIAVGASNGENELTAFTSGGDGIDILAPGEKVWSYGVFQGLQVLDGTSIATAHVTGAVALLLEEYPNAKLEFVRQLMMASSNQEVGGSNLGILNITDALAMAEDFEVEKRADVIVPQEPAEETYDTSGIISGSWGGGDHKQSVSVIDNVKRINIAAYVSSRVDYWYGSTSAKMMKCKPLHGVHNYVANLNFIYKAATSSGSVNLGDVSQVTNYINGVMVPCITDKTYGASDFDLLRVALIDVCVGNLKKEMDKIEGLVLKDNTQRKHAMLGVAAHLLGDTFAHRTMIPSGATGGSAKGSKTFNKSDFEWADFEKRFKATAVEFRDINHYLKPKKSNIYTDRIDFFPNRYVATKAGVNKIFARYNNGYAFSVAKFYTETGFAKKLNNFQAYVKSAGFSDNVSAFSTSNYRVDKPNGIVSSNETDYVDYPHYIYQ